MKIQNKNGKPEPSPGHPDDIGRFEGWIIVAIGFACFLAGYAVAEDKRIAYEHTTALHCVEVEK